jgi:hypothetical protein
LAYGLSWPPDGDYEIDHRIEESLGGAQTVANLYPQQDPDYHQKDVVEASLHRSFCAGEISLAAARIVLLSNWREVYASMQSSKNGATRR